MDCFEHFEKVILQAIRPYIHNHDNMLRLDYLITVAKGINTKGMCD
jgi:hypothetical protein